MTTETETVDVEVIERTEEELQEPEHRKEELKIHDGGGGDEDEEEDDEEDDEGDSGDFLYQILFKGHVFPAHHYDSRSPETLMEEFQLSLLFPYTPESLFTSEELKVFEGRGQDRDRRFKRKDAKAWMFGIGDAVIDPREVVELRLYDNINPNDDGEDDGEDEEETKAPEGDPHGAMEPPITPPSKWKGDGSSKLDRLRRKNRPLPGSTPN